MSVKDSQEIVASGGGIIVPRRLGWGIIALLISVTATGATWAATTNSRVAALETAAIKIETQEKTLARMQLTLCRMCTAQLGGVACQSSCQ